jgi:hypothetical protein
LIISTIQPKSLSFAAATGHLNSNLAFTFVAVRVAANVLPNAGNRPRAKGTIADYRSSVAIVTVWVNNFDLRQN